jgi:hypothetical protein
VLATSSSPPSVFVYNKRFSSQSFNLNNAVLFDEQHFGHCQADYVHVEGKKNVLADAKSRGLSLGDSTEFGHDLIVESLRRLLGDFPLSVDTARALTEGVGKGEVNVLPLHSVSESIDNIIPVAENE